MKLKEYWDQIPAKQKQTFAKACGCSEGHMRNVVNGYKPITPKLAYAIDRVTSGVVPKEKLCPDFQW